MDELYIFAASKNNSSGCSVARYRATFGMWRPQVRILPSRLIASQNGLETRKSH
jgi:hypothetical protein